MRLDGGSLLVFGSKWCRWSGKTEGTIHHKYENAKKGEGRTNATTKPILRVEGGGCHLEGSKSEVHIGGKKPRNEPICSVRVVCQRGEELEYMFGFIAGVVSTNATNLWEGLRERTLVGSGPSS